METEERSALEERCGNYKKEKSNRKINVDFIFLAETKQIWAVLKVKK